MYFNRRKFLYYSSLSGFSLLAGACSSKSNPAATALTDSQNASTENKKIGVALVGLGNYSTGILAPALQLTKHCYLAGIATGTPEKIPTWQEKYSIKDQNVYTYDNLHTIADNDEIDVVYIVVPTGLHAKYAVTAANAGKHVWCEKPMALNVAECQQILDACTQNKVKLSIAYRMQHEPNTQTVMEYAKSKPYGAFKVVTAMAGYSGRPSIKQPSAPHYGKNWRLRKDLGGGALYDMGVYTVNGLRYATNLMPTKVLSAKQYANRPDLFSEVDETTEYTLLFPNGLVAQGKTSVGETFNKLRVESENGWYELSPMQSYSGVQGQTSDGTLLNKPIQSQQAQQMDDDALALLNNQDMMVPGIEGLIDIRIINAIMESARSGKEVDIAG